MTSNYDKPGPSSAGNFEHYTENDSETENYNYDDCIVRCRSDEENESSDDENNYYNVLHEIDGNEVLSNYRNMLTDDDDDYKRINNILDYIYSDKEELSDLGSSFEYDSQFKSFHGFISMLDVIEPSCSDEEGETCDESTSNSEIDSAGEENNTKHHKRDVCNDDINGIQQETVSCSDVQHVLKSSRVTTSKNKNNAKILKDSKNLPCSSVPLIRSTEPLIRKKLVKRKMKKVMDYSSSDDENSNLPSINKKRLRCKRKATKKTMSIDTEYDVSDETDDELMENKKKKQSTKLKDVTKLDDKPQNNTSEDPVINNDSQASLNNLNSSGLLSNIQNILEQTGINQNKTLDMSNKDYANIISLINEYVNNKEERNKSTMEGTEETKQGLLKQSNKNSSTSSADNTKKGIKGTDGSKQVSLKQSKRSSTSAANHNKGEESQGSSDEANEHPMSMISPRKSERLLNSANESSKTDKNNSGKVQPSRLQNNIKKSLNSIIAEEDIAVETGKNKNSTSVSNSKPKKAIKGRDQTKEPYTSQSTTKPKKESKVDSSTVSKQSASTKTVKESPKENNGFDDDAKENETIANADAPKQRKASTRKLKESQDKKKLATINSEEENSSNEIEAKEKTKSVKGGDQTKQSNRNTYQSANNPNKKLKGEDSQGLLSDEGNEHLMDIISPRRSQRLSKNLSIDSSNVSIQPDSTKKVNKLPKENDGFDDDSKEKVVAPKQRKVSKRKLKESQNKKILATINSEEDNSSTEAKENTEGVESKLDEKSNKNKKLKLTKVTASIKKVDDNEVIVKESTSNTNVSVGEPLIRNRSKDSKRKGLQNIKKRIFASEEEGSCGENEDYTINGNVTDFKQNVNFTESPIIGRKSKASTSKVKNAPYLKKPTIKDVEAGDSEIEPIVTDTKEQGSKIKESICKKTKKSTVSKKQVSCIDEFNVKDNKTTANVTCVLNKASEGEQFPRNQPTSSARKVKKSQEEEQDSCNENEEINVNERNTIGFIKKGTNNKKCQQIIRNKPKASVKMVIDSQNMRKAISSTSVKQDTCNENDVQDISEIDTNANSTLDISERRNNMKYQEIMLNKLKCSTPKGKESHNMMEAFVHILSEEKNICDAVLKERIKNKKDTKIILNKSKAATRKVKKSQNIKEVVHTTCNQQDSCSEIEDNEVLQSAESLNVASTSYKTKGASENKLFKNKKAVVKESQKNTTTAAKEQNLSSDDEVNVKEKIKKTNVASTSKKGNKSGSLEVVRKEETAPKRKLKETTNTVESQDNHNSTQKMRKLNTATNKNNTIITDDEIDEVDQVYNMTPNSSKFDSDFSLYNVETSSVKMQGSVHDKHLQRLCDEFNATRKSFDFSFGDSTLNDSVRRSGRSRKPTKLHTLMYIQAVDNSTSAKKGTNRKSMSISKTTSNVKKSKDQGNDDINKTSSEVNDQVENQGKAEEADDAEEEILAKQGGSKCVPKLRSKASRNILKKRKTSEEDNAESSQDNESTTKSQVSVQSTSNTTTTVRKKRRLFSPETYLNSSAIVKCCDHTQT